MANYENYFLMDEQINITVWQVGDINCVR